MWILPPEFKLKTRSFPKIVVHQLCALLGFLHQTQLQDSMCSRMVSNDKWIEIRISLRRADDVPFGLELATSDVGKYLIFEQA